MSDSLRPHRQQAPRLPHPWDSPGKNITFLPRSKHLLISWLQSPFAVILEPPKIKSDTVSTVSPSICHEVMGPDAKILVFWMLSCKPTFSLSSFRQYLFSFTHTFTVSFTLYSLSPTLLLISFFLKSNSVFLLVPTDLLFHCYSVANLCPTLCNPHHFMGNRWGNSGWLYFSGLQNHCRWWLQPWN